jgi:hypothetical protein
MLPFLSPYTVGGESPCSNRGDDSCWMKAVAALLLAFLCSLSSCAASFADLQQKLRGGSLFNPKHAEQAQGLPGASSKQVDELMTQPRTAADTWKAYSLCKAALQVNPDDTNLKLRTAEALLAYLRNKTDGNALR